MRQTIGSTWIFQLVIIFTFIFAGYIALTINFSKSFKVKNEMLSQIEKNQGMTSNGVRLINNYLVQTGYKTTGKCKIDAGPPVYGAKSLDANTNIGSLIEIAVPNKEYYYCFSKVSTYHEVYKSRAYYRVQLFFRFDLPVLGDIYAFNIDGQTSEIDSTYDQDNFAVWGS